MKTKAVILFLIFTFLTSCSKKAIPIIINLDQTQNREILNKSQKSNWQNLDFHNDKVSGISLNRTYNDLIKNKKGSKIIVAVLDTEFDINHKDIIKNIWVNEKEIYNNGIDDDKNGYVDDIHGWNFVGNNNGKSIINSSYECSRIIRFFKKHSITNSRDSLLYKKALTKQLELNKTFLSEKKRIDFYKSVFPRCFKTIKRFFPKGNYSNEQIDSLYKVYEKKDDKNLYYDLYLLNQLKKSNLDSTWVSESIKSFEYDTQTMYNENYNEKEITEDNPNDANDSIYGSNNLSKYAKKTWHGTQILGLINSCYIGHGNVNVKIMPIVLSGIEGEDNDKDILTAIKYAVNNGAKVINMSSGKELSLHPEWLKKALLYAQKKDVLIITSAGNSGKNIDLEPRYLLDYDEISGKEFCNNLIKVAGNSFNSDENLPYNKSNYGYKNVDLFAPSNELYVPDANEGYKFNSGTSLGSAITAGVAGLIRSYYPKLTAAQVKQIILDSGTPYDIEVLIPGGQGKKAKFSELSKSGKVLNVYNAMKMAEAMSKN